MDLRSPGAILLISCYELGHQPLGVALPLGFLERAGFAPAALDISVEQFDTDRIARAQFIAISVPMHTALRLGVRVAARVRELNPDAVICFYGLYAALNSEYLLQNGADYCIGGEIEAPLLDLVQTLNALNGHGTNGKSRAPAIDLDGVIRPGGVARPYLRRQSFALPARTPLPTLERYAHLEHRGENHVTGYVEASRGCLHL